MKESVCVMENVAGSQRTTLSRYRVSGYAPAICYKDTGSSRYIQSPQLPVSPRLTHLTHVLFNINNVPKLLYKAVKLSGGRSVSMTEDIC